MIPRSLWSTAVQQRTTSKRRRASSKEVSEKGSDKQMSFTSMAPVVSEDDQPASKKPRRGSPPASSAPGSGFSDDTKTCENSSPEPPAATAAAVAVAAAAESQLADGAGELPERADGGKLVPHGSPQSVSSESGSSGSGVSFMSRDLSSSRSSSSGTMSSAEPVPAAGEWQPARRTVLPNKGKSATGTVFRATPAMAMALPTFVALRDKHPTPQDAVRDANAAAATAASIAPASRRYRLPPSPPPLQLPAAPFACNQFAGSTPSLGNKAMRQMSDLNTPADQPEGGPLAPEDFQLRLNDSLRSRGVGMPCDISDAIQSLTELSTFMATQQRAVEEEREELQRLREEQLARLNKTMDLLRY